MRFNKTVQTFVHNSVQSDVFKILHYLKSPGRCSERGTHANFLYQICRPDIAKQPYKEINGFLYCAWNVAGPTLMQNAKPFQSKGLL